jgi:hypothetical protein
MCNKISFNQDRSGKIYHAGGLTYSHSDISALWKINDDSTNKYEFNPGEGLKTDKEIFTPKASHVKKVESFIKPFKNKKYFEAYGSDSDHIDWKHIRPIIPHSAQFKKYLKRIESIKWLSSSKKELPLNLLNIMKSYSKVIGGQEREVIVLGAAMSAAESAAESAAWSAARSAAWSAAMSAAESAAWSAARSAAWILFPTKLQKQNNIFEYYLKVAEAGYLIYKVTDNKIYLLSK